MAKVLLRFSVISLLLLVSLAPFLASTATMVYTTSGQEENDVIGPVRKVPHVPRDHAPKHSNSSSNSSSRTPPPKDIIPTAQEAERAGIAGELIRHDPWVEGSYSSRLVLEIERSLARARKLRASKRSRTGMHAELTSGAPFEYLMKIAIGTPPQHLLAVADTGSDLVWLQCARPPSFADPRFFDPARSTSYSDLGCHSRPCHRLRSQYPDWVSCSSSDKCEYSYFYADDSNTTGDLAADLLRMKAAPTTVDTVATTVDAVARSIAFGCARRESSQSALYLAADGVVGLGRGPLSLPGQLGARFGKRFSYCLVDRTKPGVRSSPILFGDIAVPRSPAVQYTPLLPNSVYPTYYYVGLEGIDVDGKRLDIAPSVLGATADGEGGTIIDSGTTYTQLAAPAYETLLESVSRNVRDYNRTSGYFDLCYDVTGVSEGEIRMPAVALRFGGGARLELPSGNAFIVVRDDPIPGLVTLCLAFNPGLDDLGFSIIGNYQQTGILFVYDLQAKRLGFLPTEC